jgi:hypothetical protein
MTINSKYLIVAVIATFATALISSSSYVFALPPDPNYDSSNTCGAATHYGDFGKQTCCWSERIPGKLPPNNKVNYCQTCTWDTTTGIVDCNKPQQQLRPSSGTVSPEGGVLEQPPIENEPPIKSGDSVFPNDGGNVLDESQPTNPTFNSNKGTITDKNLAQDQPMQFSSNDEQSQESEESTETNNADASSNSQENDDSSTSESTTSLSKKGNTQNSPVPPECPKQAPVPPDCTMKPKF